MENRAMLRAFENVFLSSSKAHLAMNLRRTVHQLGFESFHYGASQAARRDPAQSGAFDGIDNSSPFVVSDFSASWAQRYTTENYVEVDPLVQRCGRSIIPVAWHQHERQLPGRAERMFDEAREHGLANGMTCSVIGRPGELALLSLTLSKDRNSDRQLVERQMGMGCMLMSFLHESLKRLNGAHESIANPVRLTRRECEVLEWVCAGKTSWEIATILKLAERTAIFHIHNAMRKLQASTRTQAVARALSLGLIQP